MGDTKAFETIFYIYERRLYYFIFSFTKSEYITEEIVQKVFIKIWNVRESIELDKSFHSFIFVLARNSAMNYLRDVGRRNSLKTELWHNLSKQYEHVENDIIFSEYREIVDNIVQSFPQTEQSVFLLSVEQGKSNIEIASLLGIQSSTVGNHLWKVKRSIRDQLLPYINSNTTILALLFPFL
ncbi:sigma-70 family RNA polymerase sigma factor [Flagellimonas onchidii]|uniref:sigma-70 family RNA polymerase sigma factor n=1 Tax=Flagellimonas onchidii TaxID=2562684 RepID=UPI001455FF30|nr:sigma-70 family RNA polymerase sigma factor [Allomuricauda onchidii]